MSSLLIKNGRVFDGNRFIAGDVLILDGIVAQIAPQLPEKADRVYDAAGMTVLPGLVDVHLHMKGVSSPAWSIDAEAGCYPFGVTAAADASAGDGEITDLETLGIQNGVFVITGTKEPFSFDKALQRLERYGNRVLGIKVCYDSKFDPQLTDEKKLVAICDFAHSRGLPLTVHTAHSPVSMERLLSVLSPGDIATHVFHPAPNSAGEDDFACLKKAKARGVYLDSCICAGEHVDFEIYRQAIQAGVYPDLIGTDLADEIAHRSGGYGLTLCMSVARLLGMPEEDVFRAVTVNAGKALGRPWGCLTEGAPADVAVLAWEKAPVDLCDRQGHRLTGECGYRCHLTVRSGTVVYEA